MYDHVFFLLALKKSCPALPLGPHLVYPKSVTFYSVSFPIGFSLFRFTLFFSYRALISTLAVYLQHLHLLHLPPPRTVFLLFYLFTARLSSPFSSFLSLALDVCNVI